MLAQIYIYVLENIPPIIESVTSFLIEFVLQE